MYLKKNSGHATDSISQKKFLFFWSVRESKWYFFGAFVLAALIHIAGFWFFSTTHLSYQNSPLLPATVYVLDRQTNNNPSLHQWLQAEDPALFSRTSHLPITLMPHIGYTPSYTTESPALAKMEQPIAHIVPPLGPIPGPVTLERATPLNPTVYAQITGTRIELGGELTGHRIQALPPSGLLSSSSIPSSPSIFLAAVGADGHIRHLFLLYSSGDLERDQKALRNLLQIRLEPVSTKNDIWGTVAYFWGIHPT